ncbi:hypothetical protein BH23PLA1_BH23PLA1_28690 [soil metagenome]
MMVLPRRFLLPWRPMLLLVLLLPVGCVGEEDALVILSPWPESRRADLDREYLDWIAQNGAEKAPKRLVWVRMESWDNPARRLGGGRPIDLLIGGPASWHSEAEWADRVVLGRSPIGLSWRSDAIEVPANWQDLAGPEWRDHLILDDPRRDPNSLAWAASRLDQNWPEGYAELVLVAGNVRRFAPGPAAMVRGEAVAALMLAVDASSEFDLPFRSLPDSPEPIEYGSLVREGHRTELARAFLQHLALDADQSDSLEGSDPKVEALLSDLLGSTLVDAHEELRAAWAALLASGRPPQWLDLLQQPPSWPPASIVKMLRDPGGDELVDTLAEQIAPNVEARAWLILSWEGPRRPIDAALLAELAGAANGRLVGEPRFLAWLRGEWRAWARQRYRWIEREAARVSEASATEDRSP